MPSPILSSNMPTPVPNAVSSARPRSFRMIAAILASIIFLALFEAMVITTALPPIAGAFAVSPVDMSLSITVYILVAAAFLPSSTWVADRFGPRKVLIVALVAFAVASVLCGQSHTFWQFIAARVLQALPAAFMLPVANLILLRSIDKKDLVAAMAIATTPALMAPIIGPAVGGFLVTYFHWAWIFYLNIPIVVVALVLVLRYVPRLPVEERKPFDTKGFLLSAAGLSGFIYGFDQLGALHADRQLAGVITVIGLVLCLLSVRHSRRTDHPCVPLSSLRIQTFRVSALTGGTAVKVPFRALAFVLPLMAQVALGMSAFQAGLLVLAYNGGDLLLKPIASRTLRRSGFRSALTVTGLLMPLTTVAWLFFTPDTPFWVLLIALVLGGAARSILMTGLIAMTFADVPRDEFGGASLLNNVLMQVIGATAVCLSALVLNARAILGVAPHASADLADFRAVIVVLIVIGLCGVPFFARLPADAGREVSGHGR
jgi:EmrB/QacA subfamily drug resistance transporter